MQQAEPFSGCAQQAPLFSSGLLLGVQQAEAFEGLEQQEDSGVTISGFVSLFF